MIRRLLLCAGIAISAAACDSPTIPESGATYVLERVDGRSIPLTYNTTTYSDGITESNVLLGSSFHFLSADSVEYRYDAVSIRTRDSGPETREPYCFVSRIGYRREPGRIVLMYSTPGEPLTVEGGKLVWARLVTGVGVPVGRRERLEFTRGERVPSSDCP
jgi:hypothetical protein